MSHIYLKKNNYLLCLIEHCTFRKNNIVSSLQLCFPIPVGHSNVRISIPGWERGGRVCVGKDLQRPRGNQGQKSQRRRVQRIGAEAGCKKEIQENQVKPFSSFLFPFLLFQVVKLCCLILTVSFWMPDLLFLLRRLQDDSSSHLSRKETILV